MFAGRKYYLSSLPQFALKTLRVASEERCLWFSPFVGDSFKQQAEHRDAEIGRAVECLYRAKILGRIKTIVESPQSLIVQTTTGCRDALKINFDPACARP